jgi:hypothetical protein
MISLYPAYSIVVVFPSSELRLRCGLVVTEMRSVLDRFGADAVLKVVVAVSV